MHELPGDATTICPGCGVALPALGLPSDDRYLASWECRNLYSELSAYTLTHPGQDFIHQLVVDSYGAQHAGGSAAKNIATAFALIGLYLVFERGYSGKEVQQMHMTLARRSKIWPAFSLATRCAGMTIQDILHAEPGSERDAMIYQWGAFVWEAWIDQHQAIAALLARYSCDVRIV